MSAPADWRQKLVESRLSASKRASGVLQRRLQSYDSSLRNYDFSPPFRPSQNRNGRGKTMKAKLVISVATAALLVGGGVAFGQGAGADRQGHAAGDASHEMGGKGEKMGGAEKAGGSRAGNEGAKGDKMGGADKMEDKGSNSNKTKVNGGDKADKVGEKTDSPKKMGGDENGHAGQQADREHIDDKADHGARDHADRGDKGDHGERDHADRGNKGDHDEVHVNIRVGGSVPNGRHLAPLRTTLVERYPQYRGFESFVENDEIIIVDPGTHKIVRTVSEGEAGMNHPASTGCK